MAATREELVALGNRVDQVLTQIQDQDNRLRAAIELAVTTITGRLDGIDTAVSGTAQNLVSTNAEVNNLGNRTASADAIVNMFQGITPQDIQILSSITNWMSTSGNNDLTQLFQQFANNTGSITGFQQQLQATENLIRDSDRRITQAEQAISSGIPAGTSFQSTPFQPAGKLILDHRIWDDLKKLTDERNGFRSWRLRFKGAFKQVTRCKK